VNKLILLMERWLEHKKREYDFNVKAGEEKFLKDLEYKRRDLDQAIKQLIETTKSVVDKIQENMYPFLPVDVEGVGRLQVVAPIKNYEHVRYLVIIDGQTERYFCGEPGTISKISVGSEEKMIQTATLSDWLSLSQHLESVVAAFEARLDEQTELMKKAIQKVQRHYRQPTLDDLSRWNEDKAKGFVPNPFDKSYQFEKYVFTDHVDAEGQRYATVITVQKPHPIKRHQEIAGHIFYDGNQLERCLIIEKYNYGDKHVEIDNINLGIDGPYVNKGLGTSLMQSLCKVLQTLGVETVTARLSSVDYKRKSQLYRYYIDKNGFELVQELTEEQWGIVTKKLNAVKDQESHG